MKKPALLIIFQLCLITTFAQLKVTNLLCENLPNPIGLDVTQPRFTWQLQTTAKNVLQTAYEIKVSEQASLKNILWISGRVSSDRSVHVPYGGKQLESTKQYYWQVRVWDNLGNNSGWSAPASWKMGLLKADDWKAKWITPGYVEDTINRPCPLFRKQFSSSKKISSAFVYITAHGLYEASINGKRVGNDYLTPGWTSYNKRLQYQVYDVKNLLQNGNNSIGVTVGSGWYRGTIGWVSQRNAYGRDIALLFQLDIQYTDG
ncbi:MAG TPA: alpha-L-rhamnosidase N-terminal domain-containing protein, partial [Chitinophagaceae bacterium]|nr:alpha-L-rhamnosidase N-terminal domain-containing protein [Chitinophagaceae bacterium]